ALVRLGDRRVEGEALYVGRGLDREIAGGPVIAESGLCPNNLDAPAVSPAEVVESDLDGSTSTGAQDGVNGVFDIDVERADAIDDCAHDLEVGSPQPHGFVELVDRVEEHTASEFASSGVRVAIV